MTIQEQLTVTAAALQNNHMQVFCVDTKEQVADVVRSLLHEGDTVATGGSRSLDEAGVTELLRSGAYRFLDRTVADITPAQKKDIDRKALSADVYLCSANAVTMRGELYNVDGNGNRVAALCYGPDSVIVVIGCNKITADMTEAKHRVKTIAAPLNAKRLHCRTYCEETGVCVAADGEFCTEGCNSDDRICSTYVVLGKQRQRNRIKVILVGEPLGF